MESECLQRRKGKKVTCVRAHKVGQNYLTKVKRCRAWDNLSWQQTPRSNNWHQRGVFVDCCLRNKQKIVLLQSTYPFSGNFYSQCFSDNLFSSLPKEINNLKRRRPQLSQVVADRKSVILRSTSRRVCREQLWNLQTLKVACLISSHATNEGSGDLIQIHYLAFQCLT